MPSMAPKSIPPPPLGTLIDDGQGALELVSVLGCGGYGVVYRARDTTVSYPSFSAVKCLMRASSDPMSRQRQLHLREIALHQLASPHPHVVSVQRVIDPPNSPYTFLVMDYCPDGDLFSMILHKRRYLGNDRLIKHVFVQLLDAVEYCHKLGIYHRDLKPENVLCFEDGLDLAITDFGLATTDKVSSEFRTGSVYHMSPECQGGAFAPTGKYSPPANDVWSLGIILLNLCTGRNPWSSASTSDATFSAYLASPTNFLTSVLPISRELNALMIDVLDIDYHKRIGIKEFRQRLRKIDSFYAPDAIFEGSMARCPWEVGLNIGADDEDDCNSCAPATPEDTFVEAHSGIAGRKDTQAHRSVWSADSQPESAIVFAKPSEANSTTSSSSFTRSFATDGMDTNEQAVASQRAKPKLRLQIDAPTATVTRGQERATGSARSSFTFTIAVSSHQSLRSPSPDYPMTPTDMIFGMDQSLHTPATIVSPDYDLPSATRTNSTSLSASYHTGFDGDTLEESVYSNNEIVRILPTPNSEKKGFDHGNYGQRYMRSASPSPEPWQSRTLQQEWMDTDDGPDSAVSFGEIVTQDSNSVEAVEGSRALTSLKNELQLEDDFATYGESESAAAWVFPVSQTPPSGSSQFDWSPIAEEVVNFHSSTTNHSSTPVAGLGLDFRSDEEEAFSGWSQKTPQTDADGSSWTHTWSALFYQETLGDAIESIEAQSSHPSPPTASSTAVQSSPAPPSSSAIESWAISSSTVKEVYTLSVDSRYSSTSTNSRDAGFSKSRSRPRSFLRFRRPFSFSFHGLSSPQRSPSASSTRNAHGSRPNIPRWTDRPVIAEFWRSDLLTSPLPRRKSFFSSGYRTRPRDVARSRLWMKGRSKSLTRSPSPRGMLRIARNWLTGAGPTRVVQVTAAA